MEYEMVARLQATAGTDFMARCGARRSTSGTPPILRPLERRIDALERMEAHGEIANMFAELGSALLAEFYVPVRVSSKSAQMNSVDSAHSQHALEHAPHVRQARPEREARPSSDTMQACFSVAARG